MQHTFWNAGDNRGAITDAIDATVEIGAYETLWMSQGASFKTIAEKMSASPGSRPSDHVPPHEAFETGTRVIKRLRETLNSWFDVKVYGEVGYPIKLRDALHPIELMYYQGTWDLIDARSIAVVGTRNPSSEGLQRTKSIVRQLVKDNFAVVSGLAQGVDTVAHETALEEGGLTIGVMGTPINHIYPRDNSELQRKIASDHLLMSQVPIERYEAQKNVRLNSWFFPERNKTMSAISEATIIIEAGNTSGTLVQAREALRQGRRLFILNSCFERRDLDWPAKFEAAGAIRVRDYDDIRRKLVQ
ncbi:MAG: DNA-protecting protein DprA [Candidatus Andeanibacterium colombiense]|uniref:DNA-protecting protein DprA n=1 Tax=Candidatus Andeanibacterium colombiense TaxID=3121345 RepID=A0AAJ5X422_9SPHN|nr:MAG: DNA-protecting protein DprA [Sphingomonadaceae bacterium]